LTDRSALLREPSTSDLALIVRAIVCRVLDEQSQCSSVTSNGTSSVSMTSLSRWLSQSLTSLRSHFVDTTPLVDSRSDNNSLELSRVNVRLDSLELGGLSDSDI